LLIHDLISFLWLGWIGCLCGYGWGCTAGNSA
jgi:hypothetical protein